MIFIDDFLSQKSIDAFEEARLASLGFGVENDDTAEASGQYVDTIRETTHTSSNIVSAQVSDQKADIIQDPNRYLSSEESFEFEDEESMIEAAHELQSQLSAALPESPQPLVHEEQEDVIEVRDERGETILIPASTFDEIEEDEEEDGEEEVNYSANDENRARKRRRRSESSGHDDKNFPQGKERCRLEQIGWNTWVRTSYRYFGP
jgi:PHD/YefM family antitoxin component YafN of YafNO toxin-antitoxin module